MADTKPGVGYVPGPKRPIFLQGFTLQAFETKYVDLVEVKKIYVVEMVSMGTGAGDVEIAIGPMGDFFDLSPGDFIELSDFGRIQLRNKTPGAKSFKLLMSGDPEFRFSNFPRGV